MGEKTLSAQEAQSVAGKAAEIVKLSGGDYVKQQVLISNIYEAMPEFKGRPLWKGLSLAVGKGYLGYTNYKGYYLQKISNHRL